MSPKFEFLPTYLKVLGGLFVFDFVFVFVFVFVFHAFSLLVSLIAQTPQSRSSSSVSSGTGSFPPSNPTHPHNSLLSLFKAHGFILPEGQSCMVSVKGPGEILSPLFCILSICIWPTSLIITP